MTATAAPTATLARPSPPAPVRPSAPPAPKPPWVERRRPRDAVSVLTILLVLSLGIPSVMIVGPLGGGGTPANLFGLGLLGWWVLAKMGTGQGVDRGPQPVRIGLLLFTVAVLASFVQLAVRPSIEKEMTAFYRGAIQIGALVGIAVFAADGIASLSRLHVLVRRLVHGFAAVALLAVIEFVTKFSPAQSLVIPGLTRNLELDEQARSSFSRVFATALHPIELGSVLGLVLPFALHYAFVAPPGRRRTVAWTEVALIAAAMPLALSRSGVVAAALGLAVSALDWPWRRRLRVLAGAAGMGVVMRVLIPGLMGSLASLFLNLFEDDSTTGRTGRYGRAAMFFKEYPWFGRGYNTLYPTTSQIFDNAYLYFATETGLLGMVAVVVLFAVAITTARGARRRSPDLETRGLAQALTGAAVTMAVLFATADLMTFMMEMQVFFLLVGVAGACWRLTGGALTYPGAPARRPA